MSDSSHNPPPRLLREGRQPPARRASVLAFLLAGGICIGLVGCLRSTLPGQVQSEVMTPAVSFDSSGDHRATLDQYCVSCHNQVALTAGIAPGGLAFDMLDVETPGTNPEVWERVIDKVRTGMMPPAGMPRPDPDTYVALASWLESEIDRAAPANLNPGRISAVHRMNRMEYTNAVRDLLALDVDVRDLLPGDEVSDGSFDNLAESLSLTTAHVERYMSVARMVTRRAVGLPPRSPEGQTFEIDRYMEQDRRMGEELPLGSRGGMAVPYYFPVDGEYSIGVDFWRQYVDYIIGMGWPQTLEFRIDGTLVGRSTVGGAPGRPAPTGGFAGRATGFGDPDWENYMHDAVDDVGARFSVDAGSHLVSVSFVRDLWESERLPQMPFRGRGINNDERYMGYALLRSIEITGPYEVSASGEDIDTPSRRQIFVCHPRRGAEEEACATEILSRMARRAYRRAPTEAEVETLLEFFDMGLEEGGSFDTGIQFALERLLVTPAFLLRIYEDPAQVEPGEVYRLSDLELASRLSFFLWSSIPDERLLDLAERGRLTDPTILEQEVRRMLADPRATETLATDFVAQWLELRRLDEVVVEDRRYPHFDQNVVEAFRQETELFVASTLREDRSVLDLLRADYTYVNERLARHYGIPDVYGSRFRRISLPDPEQRGGLLGHGSILSITSYPDRTSPVLRGKYLLTNFLGTPPAAPPDNVATDLAVAGESVPPSIRERLEEHRENPACFSCHAVIDPPGFALENFDAIGGWRTSDESGNPIDFGGAMPNGREVQGLTGLRAYLLDNADSFVGIVTEKLMVYALGRTLEYYDGPAVRKIVRDAAADDYRWSSIVHGVVQSPAFLMRTAPEGASAD